jgi:hypothetical protein
MVTQLRGGRPTDAILPSSVWCVSEQSDDFSAEDERRVGPIEIDSDCSASLTVDVEDMADLGVDLEEEKNEEDSADLDSERADEEEEVGVDSFLWGLV